jgi:phage terminase small subunit
MTTEEEGYWAYFAPLQVRSGLLTLSSREVLRSYCQELVTRDRLALELRTSPVLIISTVIDGAGNEHPKVSANPLLTAKRQQEATLHTLASALCLEPAAAMRLPRQAAPEVDPLDQYPSVAAKIRAVK